MTAPIEKAGPLLSAFRQGTEAMGITGIQYEIDSVLRYATWLRQSAERTPWHFSEPMVRQIEEAFNELDRALKGLTHE